MSSNKMTSKDLESLFVESYTTVFCSHNRDGTIHATPIWYNYKDGVFYFVSIKKSKRGNNVKRNKNVSLSFLMQGTKAIDGVTPSKCALVYGLAKIGFEPEMGYDDFLRWVWGKYSSAGSNTSQTFDHESFETLKVVSNKIVHFYP
jgi:nitroimidazol reductase NimA-like FMN-containing flavoprotein (pyridoxamine 5'-phosphate oxidase superfamily)